MRTKLITCLFFIGIMFSIFPISAKAFEVTNSISDSAYLLNRKDDSQSVEKWLAPDIQDQNCNSLLGDPTDEDSVAWLLQQIFNFIKIIGPILVVILSGLDFAKVIINSDDESMAKAIKKLGHRLILAGVLFFIPLLVEVMLDLFGFTSICGLK